MSHEAAGQNAVVAFACRAMECATVEALQTAAAEAFAQNLPCAKVAVERDTMDQMQMCRVLWNEGYESTRGEHRFIGAITRLFAATLRRLKRSESLALSEVRYRWVFDDNLTPMAVYDHALGRFVDVNRAACDYYGYPREEFLRMSPLDFYSAARAAKLKSHLDEFRAGTTSQFDSVHNKRDGTIATVQVTVQDAPWEGASASLITVQDLTARIAAVERIKSDGRQLARSEERYRKLFEDNHTPMLVRDNVTQKLIEANAAACTFYGYTHAELLALGPLALFPPDRHAHVRKHFETADRGPSNFEAIHVKADGSHADVHVSLTSLPWDDTLASLIIVHDISERNAILAQSDSRAEALARSEARYRTLFEDNPSPMLVTRASSVRFIDVNRAACEYYGYSREEFLKSGPEIFFPDDQQEIFQALLARVRTDTTAHFDTTHLKSDGASVDVHVTMMGIPWDDGPARLAMIQDIGERNATLADLKSSNEAFRRAQRIAHIGNSIYDIRSGERYWSEEIFRLLGIPKEDGIPTDSPPHRAFFSDADLERMALMNRRATEDGGAHGSDHQVLRRDGTTAWMHQELVAEFDDEGRAIRLLGTLHDITDYKNTEAMLESQARVDSLTGLPNRTAATEQLTAAVSAASRNHAKAAVLFIDVDQFKNINDTLGHTAGDRLLQELGKRLRRSLRSSDFVGRMGGDEFVVILPDVSDSARVVRVAESIMASINRPVKLDREVVVTVSMGIALYPQDGTTAEALVMNADTAMYQGKREGRSRYRFFSEEMHAAAEEQLRLDYALRKGIENHEFVIHYQPIVSAREDVVIGTEALVRWEQSDGSLLPPSAFIPYAEESGLIVPLGNWILQTACARNARWNAKSGAALRINVNVSAKQIADPGFVQTVFDALTASGLRADLLELEFTETAISCNPGLTNKVVLELQAAGVRIALDDFGTGYNSLVNLRTMPVDTLKLEKCFVDEVMHNSIDQAIASAVLTASRSLGATALAEGVETPEQNATLRLLGFDELQGYLFAKPMPAEDVETFLTSAHWQPRRGKLHSGFAA